MIFLKSTRAVRILGVLAPILLSLLILQTEASAQQPAASHPAAPKRSAKKGSKKAAPEPPPAPAPPPLPPTLEQMPALPPQVHYSNGQLTIVAENSSLADILRAVRTQTRAEVEIPSNANERVVGHFGPGPARDVLTALLHGVNFNYVMVGSPAHPDGVDRLILTSKSIGTPEPGTAMVAAPPPPQANNEGPGEDAATPSPDAEPSAEDAPENATNGEAPPPTPDGQQQVKTPEQLLRELQQQQLLQQQQQQQQQGQQGTPPPN